MKQPPNFNRLAGLYRWMELFTFGPWLSLARGAFLAETAPSRFALVLGDGDGRFTARLLRANPSLQIDAVDVSPAMLEALLLGAGPNASRVRVHLADIREWEPARPVGVPRYDLIVSNFFLDCLTTQEIQSLAAKLHRATTSSALWLIAEFAVPSGWFGRFAARPIVWFLYWVFGQLTGLDLRSLPDHPGALRQSGFMRLQYRTWLGGLLVSELWSVSPSHSAVSPTTKPL